MSGTRVPGSAREMDAGAAQMCAGRLKDGYEAPDLLMAADYCTDTH